MHKRQIPTNYGTKILTNYGTILINYGISHDIQNPLQLLLHMREVNIRVIIHSIFRISLPFVVDLLLEL
jgi:hypothetical protein